MGDLGQYNKTGELFYEGRLADNFKVSDETGSIFLDRSWPNILFRPSELRIIFLDSPFLFPKNKNF